MTNEQIIYNEQKLLFEQGKIKQTGRYFVLHDEDGNEIELPEYEAIHTFQVWKTLGYYVKKGEKAISQFTIWKYVNGKRADKPEKETEGRCIMKKSSFFSMSQVEKAVEA